jgi:hypothetical protein
MHTYTHALHTHYIYTSTYSYISTHANTYTPAHTHIHKHTHPQGKPLPEALGEIAYAAGFLDFYAAEAVRVLGTVHQPYEPHTRVLSRREPLVRCECVCVRKSVCVCERVCMVQ